LHSPEGEGEGGCYLYSPEDFINKNVSYTSIIIKSIPKMAFLMKTSETKKFVKIFCEAFLIFKKIFCLSHPGFIFIFYKKGFLNSQAVRVRVNQISADFDSIFGTILAF
jgi:hypothetical protein